MSQRHPIDNTERLCNKTNAEISCGQTSKQELAYLSAFNVFLSITAVLGNILILVALRKVSSLHPPSKLLFRCLAITDLCVGLITGPLSVVYSISLANEQLNLCRYAYASFVIVSYTLCSVSLLTASAIRVDRLLALLLGLRYRQVVTLKRAYLIVVTFWAVSTIFSAMQFFNIFIALWCGIILILLCLVTSTFCYTKIFLTLRHNQNQVQEHVQRPNQINQLNTARYRKAVSTALWLTFTLLACYLPQVILVTLLGIHAEPSSSVSLAFGFTTTLVFVNPSLNPILYCWKIDEVRQAVKDTIRQALCC